MSIAHLRTSAGELLKGTEGWFLVVAETLDFMLIRILVILDSYLLDLVTCVPVGGESKLEKYRFFPAPTDDVLAVRISGDLATFPIDPLTLSPSHENHLDLSAVVNVSLLANPR